jgi:hypothetical protein
MATERQIQANRANAKRSTGPVTEAGKQASSQNARRHGQLSSCVVLKAESTPLFDELMDSLLAEFQPQTANETALVETMAVSRWKLSRNWIMHTALLEVETVKQDPSAGNEPVLTALAFKSLADSSHSLHLLHRYEVSLDRQYSRALNNLLKSRAAARNQEKNENPLPPDQPVPAVTPQSTAAPEPKREFPKEPNLPPESAAPLRQDKGRPTLKSAPVTPITSRTPPKPVVKAPQTPAAPPKPGKI